jgi:uncharacterized membrane protein YdjX (TVP38/TMEM64 family)
MLARVSGEQSTAVAARAGGRRQAWIALGAGVIVIGAVWWSGVIGMEPHALAARIRAAGPVGPLALFALLVLQCVLAPIPSEPVMMAAGYLYGPLVAFSLSWLGVVVGAAACFMLARALGRPFAERFVRPDRLLAFDTYLQRRGPAAALLLVLGTRLFAFTSFDVVSYGCGLMRLPFGWFVLATAVGVIPKAFAFSYAGATMAARPAWLDALILAGIFGMLLAVPLVVRHARRGAGG